MKSKKIVFRKVDPADYGSCMQMPLGAIAASCAPGESVIPDSPDVTGEPVMRNHTFTAVAELPEFEFGLSVASVMSRVASLTIQDKSVTPAQILSVLAGTATDLSATIRLAATRLVEKSVNDHVKSYVEASLAAGLLLGPFRVAAEIVLNDGQSVTCGLPRLMIPNDMPLRVGVVDAVQSGDAVVLTIGICCQPARLCWRLRSRGNLGANVSSVRFRSTAPVDVWSAALSLSLSSITQAPVTQGGDIDSNGRLCNVSPTRPSAPHSGYRRGFVAARPGNIVTEALAAEGAVWHSVAELSSLPEISDAWRTVIYSGSSSSLFNGKGETLDLTAHRVVVSGLIADAADRVLVARPVMRYPSPCPPLGWLPVAYDTSGNPLSSSGGGAELTEVLVTLADGTVLRETPAETMPCPSSGSGWIREWIYPAEDARRVVMVRRESGVESAVAFEMSAVLGEGYSRSVSEGTGVSAAEVSALRGVAVARQRADRADASLLIDGLSGAYGLAGKGMRLVFSARLSGVARAVGLSGNAYYVFTDGGVWLVRRSAAGVLAMDRMLATSAVTEPFSILETVNAVYYHCPYGWRKLKGMVVTALESIGEESGATLFDGLKGAASLTAATEDGWLLTYPLDHGLKKVERISLVGCGMSGEPEVLVYVSSDLSEWRLVRHSATRGRTLSGICGSQGRYMRLLILHGRPEGVILTGI